MRGFAIVFVQSDGHPGTTGEAEWTPFRGRRIRAGPASTAHPQSLTQACTQPACHGSVIAGLCTLFMRPARVLRSSIVLKRSTLLHLDSVLRKRKYRMLFSPRYSRRP